MMHWIYSKILKMVIFRVAKSEMVLVRRRGLSLGTDEEQCILEHNHGEGPSETKEDVLIFIFLLPGCLIHPHW